MTDVTEVGDPGGGGGEYFMIIYIIEDDLKPQEVLFTLDKQKQSCISIKDQFF